MKTLNMKKFLLILSASFLFIQIGLAQDVSGNIEKAFSNGDAEALSEYFNQNVELVMEGPGKIYNKNQALIILKDFFSDNRPDRFQKLHEGNKDNSIFMIGNMMSSGKTFRISVLLKKSGGEFLIHQIRIQDV